MLDLTQIPANRLAMLDTAELFRGPHGGGGPDCRHCARELAYEIVTGRHADANPPDCTEMFSMLPNLNDGPWSSDALRTEVLRPYLRPMLMLDPARDRTRAFAVADYAVRVIAPAVLDRAGLTDWSAKLRELAPLVAVSAPGAARAAADAARAAADAAYATADAADAAAKRSAASAAISAARAAVARAADWEIHVRGLLDRVCAIV